MTLQSAPAAVVAVLSALVEERAGLHYGSADKDILVSKASDRAREIGFTSLLDYYYYLRYDRGGAAETEQLVETLVVGETYFFRELAPLELIARRFIAPRVAVGKRPRIWSAGCATGEEPLTLAAVLARQGLLSKCELIASDVSQRFLDRARAGRFNRRALRDLPRPVEYDRWIKQDAHQEVSVAVELRESIDWRRINLCSLEEVAGVGSCDVIVCRNVMIYFRDETIARLLGKLTELLVSDGALFVGVSESLLRFGTALVPEEDSGVHFYRKAEGGQR